MAKTKNPVITITLFELFAATWPHMIIINSFFDNNLRYKLVFENETKWVFRMNIQQQRNMRSTMCKFSMEIPKSEVVMSRVVETIEGEIGQMSFTERTCEHVYFSLIPDLFRIYAFNNFLFQDNKENL
jgi:hypothetical protein